MDDFSLPTQNPRTTTNNYVSYNLELKKLSNCLSTKKIIKKKFIQEFADFGCNTLKDDGYSDGCVREN